MRSEAAATGVQRLRTPFAAAPLDRRRVALVAVLLALAAVAWLVTGDRMSGMDSGPNTDPGTLGFYVSTWVVMMAAMMFPSISPMVSVYARLNTGRRESGRSAPVGATVAFVAGYILTWTVAGLVGFAIVKVARSLSIDALSWDSAGPYVAGGVIVTAGVYQLTPLKDVCLTHCRGPLTFLIRHWRDGRLGALRMGVVHGGWCVGCCWALMAALFALGVMSLKWMVLIAALIALEKMLPWKRVASIGVAVCLVALGLAVAFVPGHVPGLTEPDSAQARGSMMEMNGGGAMPPAKDEMEKR